MEKIYCKNCRASCKVTLKYDKYDQYFFRQFLCKKCLKKYNNVIILGDNSELFDYFTFYKIFEKIKFDFLEPYIKSNQKKFRGKISSDFLKELNPIAYQTLKNSKHFGIRKEKLRIAERYVHQTRKETLQNLNIALLEDELANLYRQKILSLQVDILYKKKTMQI